MFHQSPEKILVTFKDVAACFSEEEWKQLHEREKLFYIDVMQKIHQALIAMGYRILNPETLLRVVKCKDLDLKNPDSRTELQDPTSSHEPALGPTPDIFFRIKYEDEKSYRDLQSSEETEMGTVPSTVETGPLMVSPDFPLQIKDEKLLCSVDPEGREALACDPGFQIINPETSLQAIKCEDSANVDVKGSKSGADFDETTSSLPPAISPPSDIILRIQHEKAQSCRDLKSAEDGKSIGTGNVTLTVIESVQTNQSKCNIQRDEWNLTEGEHDQLPELMNKLAHSQNNQMMPYECTESRKSFSNSSALIGHQTMHTREKPYGCTECEKSFSDPSALKMHHRIHTGKKSFECRYCKKYFTRSSYLKVHQRIHTGEKPFECTKCKKGFTQLSYMRRHERIHTEEKPFECTECDKSFRDHSALKLHRRRHTLEKMFECSECKKCFIDSSQLKEHQRIHIEGSNLSE